jgi:hypothetical protein
MKYRYAPWQDKLLLLTLLLLTLLLLFYSYSTYVRVAIRAFVKGPPFTWSYIAGVRLDGTRARSGGAGLSGHEPCWRPRAHAPVAGFHAHWRSIG